jgi:RHS repeat-associated protein
VAQITAEQSEYFLADALGSVRNLTDSAGGVTLTQSYTPFGEILESFGDGQTDYAYTGEMYDPNTGLVFLRARYYSPADGRFTSRDVWDGDNKMPMSYNSWLYVYANPILFTDPSGQIVCEGIGPCMGENESWRRTDGTRTRNVLGRHLTNDEQKALAVYIMSETSLFTDTGYFDWIIWGLLNKISYDQITVYKKHWSVYQSWQNEESEVNKMLQFKLQRDFNETYENTKDVLLRIAQLYENGSLKDQNLKIVLTEKFRYVLSKIKNVENEWVEWGPGSIKDPTSGGVGHIKVSADNMNSISEARRLAKLRCSYGLYSIVSPIYEDRSFYRFIEMNKGAYNPLYHDWLLPLNRSRKVYLYGNA